MAFPAIVFDNTNGNDTTSSGAPYNITAISGSTGRTRNVSNQLHFGFFGLTSSLSTVPTDGSAALYMAISTAGQRNFSSISAIKDTRHVDVGNITSGAAVLSAIGSTSGWTAGDVVKVTGAGAASADLYSTILSVDSSTQVTLNDNASTTVTGAVVENPKQATLDSAQGVNTGATNTSWAIGGLRKTFDNTNSRKLWENNSSTGDAKGGWRVWSVSGDTQTIASATINVRNVEDTNGPFIWGTQPGYTTKATWIFGGNTNMWAFRHVTTGVGIQNVIAQCSNTTKTASCFATGASGGLATFEGVEIYGSSSTTQFWRGFRPSNGNGTAKFRLYNCRVENCASHGIGEAAANSVFIFAEGCTIKGNGGWGVSQDANSTIDLINCIITGNTSGGVQLNATRTVSDTPVRIQNCTIHGNTGDNIQIISTLANGVWFANLRIVNNFITGSGGYGINFNGSGMTAAAVSAYLMRIQNNVYGFGSTVNTSGWCNLTLSSDVDISNTAVDPQYTNTGSGDFTPTNTALKGTAFPTIITNPGGTTNYEYPGAIQPNATGGSAGMLYIPNLEGM